MAASKQDFGVLSVFPVISWPALGTPGTSCLGVSIFSRIEPPIVAHTSHIRLPAMPRLVEICGD